MSDRDTEFANAKMLLIILLAVIVYQKSENILAFLNALIIRVFAFVGIAIAFTLAVGAIVLITSTIYKGVKQLIIFKRAEKKRIKEAFEQRLAKIEEDVQTALYNYRELLKELQKNAQEIENIKAREQEIAQQKIIAEEVSSVLTMEEN